MRIAFAVLLIALGACEAPGDRAKPEKLTERGIFFSERDHRGHEHPLSAAKSAPNAVPRKVERVSNGATLDVDSSLQIQLQHDVLGIASDDLQLETFEPLIVEARELRKTLDAYAEIQIAQVTALQEWEELSQASPAVRAGSVHARRFEDAKREYAEKHSRFTTQLKLLWPKNHADRKSVDVAFQDLELEAIDFEAFSNRIEPILQRRVDDLARNARSKLREAQTKLDDRKLRIEAFLIRGEGSEDPEAVHVEGYDDLRELSVQAHDRNGLKLTERERVKLLEVMTTTNEVAAALERIRREKVSLDTALGDLRSDFGKRLAEQVKAVEALLGELEAKSLDHRIEETRKALTKFQAEFEAQISAGGKALGDKLAKLAALVQLKEQVSTFVEQFKSLKEKLDDPSSFTVESFLKLVGELQEFTRTIETLSDSRSDLLETATKELQEALQEVRDALKAQEVALEAQWEQSEAKAQLQGWVSLASRTHDTAKDLLRAIGIARTKPAALDVRNPGALDVSLGQAADTKLDLRRTRAIAGDSLQVRTTVLDAGQVVDSNEVVFEIEHLGLHAELVPSVVFVTGDSVAGASDNGGFSASLGWLWSDPPRDDDDAGWSRFTRFTQWSAGIHAVFLNFGPDNDAEIGLGATLGLWQNRLQVGIGFNPMAEDSRDGQVYYFIGSSLIPLLQSLKSKS